MRLLNVKSLELVWFGKGDIPKYAIASHLWDAGEPSIQDFRDEPHTESSGSRKIKAFAKCVRDSFPWLDWLWMDTCCIDRSNALELSETINSMFSYYQNAEVCIVYLADVRNSENDNDLRESRWFTRGWTLQELIAPDVVVFKTYDWQTIGYKGNSEWLRRKGSLGKSRALEPIIASITRIPETVLHDRLQLNKLTVQEKLELTRGRNTAVPEDAVYCLLGILDVVMSANYGEGKERAMQRLEAALRRSSDTSDTAKSNSVYGVPPRHRVDYVERGELTSQIITKLSTPGAKAALVGLGGMGKTELALNYVYHVREQASPTRVVWIRAGDVTVFVQSVRDAVDQAELDGDREVELNVLQTLSTWLQDRRNGPWLVILDDADDVDFLLEPPHMLQDAVLRRRIDYIPVCAHGSVLMMTRNIQEAKKIVLSSNIISVGPMDVDGAVSLFRRRLGNQDTLEDIEELAEALGCCPLTIGLAAAYIERYESRGSAVRRVLEEFRQQNGISKEDITRDETRDSEVWRQFEESRQHSEISEKHMRGETAWDRGAGSAANYTRSRSSSVSSANTIFSIASVASTMSSVVAAVLSDATINNFVESLFCTPELALIHNSAIMEQAIGDSKYERNLRRIIANCGTALRAEVGIGKNLTAARLLQSRNVSTRAARSIVRGIGQQSTKRREEEYAVYYHVVDPSFVNMSGNNDDLNDDASIASSDEDEPDLDADDIDERAIIDDMKSSQAILQFRTELLKFAHLPYSRRIQRALRLEQDNDSYLDQEMVLGLGDELSWIPPHLFNFHHQEELGLFDHLRVWLEESTGEEWDWWPLQPLKRAIRTGDVRVKWQTPCRNPRSIDVPRSVGLALQKALTTAPAFLSINPISVHKNDISCTHTTSAPCSHSNASSSAKTSVAISQTATPQAGSQQVQASSQPQQSQQSTSTIAPGGQNSATQRQPQLRRNHFVYLCIKTGTEWRPSKIKIHKYVTDARVFSALRRKYLTRKGMIRRWLSCWQYSHCQFYEFSKYPYGAAPFTVGFPPDGEPKYDFITPVSPRPSPQVPFGPITPQEFRDRFYTFCEDCCHSWHRKQMLKWLPSLADEDRIQVLPKRNEALQWADRKTEVFWGLKVCEAISASKVTTYVVLFNTPAIAFFFLWLFSWSHPSDLQNASMPFFASITLTISFMSWIARSRKGEVD